MALAPRTVQNMPERLSLDPITVLHPASITPEPTNNQLFLILPCVQVPHLYPSCEPI
jgi:hypothetical protein